MHNSETNPFVSYIIPAYQAESFLYNNLKAFHQFCVDAKQASEIIIINDGSTDKTNQTIEAYLKDHRNGFPVKHYYIDLKKNGGKGQAIKKGIAVAKGQFIIFTDCDLPYSFKNITDITHALVHKQANVAIADRMHADSVFMMKSGNLSYIYIRHTAGRVFNFFVKLFSGLKMEDTQAGLKGFDKETAEKIFDKMTIPGFSFDIDILVCAKALNKTILTVPIEFNYVTEMSTVSFIKHTFLALCDLIRICNKRVMGYYRK
ncbi:MAG: glycosyltransferase [Desulfobacteraceae bacterium]|nr:MAG: glycosyltransferase [Desulfobacteraceae bacterium]